MKLSIVTPVYNAQATIEKTILSVIHQERNWELEYIVVDGGSNDGTLDIIHRYEEYIHSVISEKDQGVYDAMNKGVAKATGDIIGIINADDWYNEGAFKLVEQAFEQYPDASIIYSPIDNYLDGQYLNTFIPGDLQNLVYKFTINHPSCFVKRSVYEQIGQFDLAYSMAADYDFIFRAYQGGVTFQAIQTPLVSYSMNGMTGKLMSKFKQIRESWKVAHDYACHTSEELTAQRKKFYRNWFLKEAIMFPIKCFVKPRVTRKVKGLIRNVFGKFPSDQYGAW